MDKDNRLVYFDYLKAFLIFFVVLGHCVDIFPTSRAFKALYLFIYTFHMPLFVFVSGFFAKWKISRFYAYFLIYFVFTILQILLKVLIIEPHVSHSFLILVGYIFDPLWGLWYLPALAVWTLSVKFIKHVKFWHIFAFIGLTLILGFTPIGAGLTLSRIFYFFPFFLLGRWCKQNGEAFTKFIEQLQKVKIKFLSILVLALVAVLIILFIDYIPKGFFYGKYSYSNGIDLIFRIISMFTGVITGLAVMFLIPYKNKSKCKIINYIGQKTLSIYLYHLLILLLIKKILVPYLTLHWSLLLLIALILSLIIIAISTTKPFVKSTNYLLNRFNKGEQKWKK